MKPGNILFTLILSLLFAACGQQATTDGLKESFEHFAKLTVEKNTEGILDATYPKLFELASRAQMKEQIEGPFNDSTVRFSIDEVTFDSMYQPFVVEKEVFCKVTYRSLMKLQIIPENPDSVEKEREAILMIAGGMKEEYGEDATVIPDTQHLIVSLKAKNQVLAIKSPAYEGWKFLEISKGAAEAMQSILPAKVLEQL